MKTPTQPANRASLFLTLIALTGFLFVLGACAESVSIFAQPTPTLENWELIWSDEFDGPDGSAVDESKWEHQTGGHGWGNAELEYYTDRVENSYIENPHGNSGVLVIKAIKESYEGRAYTSARLTTRNRFEQTFGRFEVRAQIPYGQGIWPAIWMLGTGGSWPFGGEIDIMENIGKEPNIVHGTIHGPGYSGAKNIGNAYSLPEGKRFADNFHTYAIEWEPNVIRWYVDNVEYHRVTPESLPEGAIWVYDHPFYLLLNVAVGGGWPGYPNSTTEFPQTMKVDFVRVYARPGGWPTLTPTP